MSINQVNYDINYNIKNNTNNTNINVAKKDGRRMCYICRQYGHLAKDCAVYLKKDHWIKVKTPDGFVHAINKDDKKRKNRARKNKRRRFTKGFHFGRKIGMQPVDQLMDDIKKAIWKYLQRFELVQKVNKLDEENRKLKEELFWYKFGEKRNQDCVSTRKINNTKIEPPKIIPDHPLDNLSEHELGSNLNNQNKNIQKLSGQPKNDILDEFMLNLPQKLEEIKQNLQVSDSDEKIENDDLVGYVDQHSKSDSVEVEAFGASFDMKRMENIRQKCINWVEKNRPKQENRMLTQLELIEYMQNWEKETSEYFTKALEIVVSKEDAEYYRKHEDEFFDREGQEMLEEFY